jgi:SAM-dependent methyltransferase
MSNSYIRDYYYLHGSHDQIIDQKEQKRIEYTLNLVPASWRSVIDVGCGDGRVSRSLSRRGPEIVGIDWSETSLRHFRGRKVVADITKPWPLNRTFEGAICAEVLEHLPVAEAHKVLENIKRFTRQGFIISVPARECLQILHVQCPFCKKDYHLWGHIQSFSHFEDVDALVGQKAEERVFVSHNGLHLSPTIDYYRRLLGYRPYTKSSLCPHCGLQPPEPGRPAFLQLVFLHVLAKLEKLTNPLRQGRGWFVCKYTL